MAASNLFSLDSLIEKSARLLMSHARAQVGFYPQEVGIGSGSATTTSLCIRALAASGLYEKELLLPLLDELFDFQKSSLGCFGSSSGACHNLSTAKSIACVLALRPDLTDSLRMRRSLLWLLRNRNSDTKGWGYLVGYPTRQYYTYYAVDAMALAAENSVIDDHRAEYLNALGEAKSFINRSQIAEGIWSSGDDDRPCPISTLTALVSLRRLGNSLRTQQEFEVGSGSRALLEEWFNAPNRWSQFILLERGQAFYIREFFPGNTFLLLDLLGPFDVLVTSSIGWLQRNLIRFNGNSLGWGIGDDGNKTINVWATAQALYSLSRYKNMLEQQVSAGSEQLTLGERGRYHSVQKVNAFDLTITLGMLGLGFAVVACWLIVHFGSDSVAKIWHGGTSAELSDYTSALGIIGPIVTGLAFFLFQLYGLKRYGRFPWRRLKAWFARKVTEKLYSEDP